MKELMGVCGYRRVLNSIAIPTIFPLKKAKRLRVSSVNRDKNRMDACAATEGESLYTSPVTEETIDCRTRQPICGGCCGR